MLRRFAGLDAGTSRMPDETTILNFRHFLEAHQLAESLFQEVVSLLKYGVTKADVDALEQIRDNRPAAPIRFE